MKTDPRFFFRTSLILSAILLIGIVSRPAYSFESKKIDSLSIWSNHLSEFRKLVIHAPTVSDEITQINHPVLFLLDGGRFDDSYFKSMDHLADYIIVEIVNEDRGLDFTPPYESFGPNDQRRLGNADNFTKFIIDELIQFFESNYPNHTQKTLIGHSWGAAYVSYLMSQNLEAFEQYFLFSPTIIYRSTVEESTNQLFVDLENQIRTKDSPEIIYLSVGDNEPDRFKEPFHHLVDFLNTNMSVEIKSEIHSGIDHLENWDFSLRIELNYS